MKHLSPPQEYLRIGTWNVQSAVNIGRQLEIDTTCDEHNLEVVCLQDVRQCVPHHQTTNFHWLTSCTSDSGTRINAFLIKKTLQCRVQQKIESKDIQPLFIQLPPQSFILVNVYMPCEGTIESHAAYQLLIENMRGIQLHHPTVPFIVCGDFIAHFGKSQLPDSPLIGPYVLHEITNENGAYMAHLLTKHQLTLATTFSSSCFRTREQGKQVSQLDHVLVPSHSHHRISSLSGRWGSLSDHKLTHFGYNMIPTPGKYPHLHLKL